jgi:hypothetical protein
VDKAALAQALGAPSGFGQSQFAFVRGHAFEARVKGDGGAELLRLVHRHLDPGAEAPGSVPVHVPDLSAAGPQGRVSRTALALREATARQASPQEPGDDGGTVRACAASGESAQAGRAAGARPSCPDEGGSPSGAAPQAVPRDRERPWTLLDHPLLALDVAGTPAFLEPDAIVVHPDGRWTVVEIKSFPMVDGSAEPAKVGAAARQAAVYVLALERLAGRVGAAPQVGHRVLLVCPRNFSNRPTAATLDVRKQLSVTRRQLARLTRIEDIAAALPEGTVFDPLQPPDALHGAVEAVPAAYAPECLSACELAFHCRARARAEGAVTALGRAVRGELGGLTTVDAVLAAAHGEAGDPRDPAVAALRRAAALRAEALAGGVPC